MYMLMCVCVCGVCRSPQSDPEDLCIGTIFFVVTDCSR